MQQENKMQLNRLASAVLLALLPASAALAVDIDFHGYGHQSFLKSSKNDFLEAGVSSGSWADNTFALAMTATIDERTKVWTQLHTTSTEAVLDNAYVEHQANANLSLRAGQQKMPIGFYNELRDVKFLQKSLVQPFIYQESEAFEAVSENFRGLSVLGTGFAGVEAQLYGGQIVADADDLDHQRHALLGTRVGFKSSNGLTVQLSAFRSKEEELGVETTRRLALVSAGYQTDRFDLKAEYGELRAFGVSGRSGYAEAGFELSEKWAPYARYDYLVTDTTQSSDPSYYQHSIVAGVEYKFNGNVRLRAENHFNRGYAAPVATGEVLAGTGQKRWNLFAAGLAFVF